MKASLLEILEFPNIIPNAEARVNRGGMTRTVPAIPRGQMRRNQGTGISRVISLIKYISPSLIKMGAGYIGMSMSLFLHKIFSGKNLQNRTSSVFFAGEEMSAVVKDKTVYFSRSEEILQVTGIERKEDDPDIVGYLQVKMHDGKEAKVAVCKSNNIALKISREKSMYAVLPGVAKDFGF